MQIDIFIGREIDVSQKVNFKPDTLVEVYPELLRSPTREPRSPQEIVDRVEEVINSSIRSTNHLVFITLSELALLVIRRKKFENPQWTVIVHWPENGSQEANEWGNFLTQDPVFDVMLDQLSALTSGVIKARQEQRILTKS